MSGVVSGVAVLPAGTLSSSGRNGEAMISSIAGLPGGQHLASLLGNSSTSENSTPQWVAEEINSVQAPPGLEVIPPPHIPLTLGIPRGPPGPLRGVIRGVQPRSSNHEFSPFLRPMPLRPPFFIREIYKNGFLKRLPYNEKKSSALAKLMKTDRFWVVFSIHDDVHPFLELWCEPTEVASKPPQYIFPLIACQHISTSIIPADTEWSFVINFDTVAIRFSCNSREVMDEWVEVLRNKLGEMGILNPKGNLYSRVPLGPPVTKPVIRDPTSPLPQPPERKTVAVDTTNAPVSNGDEMTRNMKSEDSGALGARPKRQSVDTSAGQNQTFTTSIYLKQESSSNPVSANKTTGGTPSSMIVARKTSLPVAGMASDTHQTPSYSGTKTMVTSSVKSLSLEDRDEDVNTILKTKVECTDFYENSQTPPPLRRGSTSKVYLNQGSPSGKHVTVIPVNSILEKTDENDKHNNKKDTTLDNEEQTVNLNMLSESVDYDNHTYGAIFDCDINSEINNTDKELDNQTKKESTYYKRQEHSPRRRGSERTKTNESSSEPQDPPPLPYRPVLRRLSERKQEISDVRNKSIHQKIRRKSKRSSSLGPLLDGQINNSDIGASTLSLESIDSNPRQAVPKSDRHLGAIPRRPLPPAPSHVTSNGQINDAENNPPSLTHPLLGSPPRNINELPPGVRPPPYHPLAALTHSNPPGGFSPMIPLPGLTCQLSIPPGLPMTPPGPSEDRGPGPALFMREQPVMRLRQEINHPAGVRLQLRKKDCQGSLALVDLFGCVWVVGWKHREFPVLYNAFHIGDQILSVSGVLIRSFNDFPKLVKLKSNELHTEIIIRRTPFAQVFHLKTEIEGQSLGILLYNNTSEIKETIPGSLAVQAGMQAKVRSFDGQTLVPLVIMEINGRPLNILSKEGEAMERLQSGKEGSRDISILVQPADIVNKFRKQLKSLRGHKDYLLP